MLLFSVFISVKRLMVSMLFWVRLIEVRSPGSDVFFVRTAASKTVFE